MQGKADERQGEGHLCLEFNGASFEEQARGDPIEPKSEIEIVEVDCHRNAPLTTSQFDDSFHAPRQLHVFLAHAMTGLSSGQEKECEAVTSAIVDVLHNTVDPIFDIYDPGDGFDPDGDCSTTYGDDEKMVFWADLLVVNHRFKADGIGMLVAQAATHGIPVICIHPREPQLSPMYEGLPARIRYPIAYDSLRELKTLLAQTIRAVICQVRTRSRQRGMVNYLSENHPGKHLCRCRILQEMTLDELSIRTGLAANYLFRIEHDGNAFLRLPLAMIWTIAQALEAEASIGSKHTTIHLPPEAESRRPDFVKGSLANLLDHIFRWEAMAYSAREDVAVVRAWSSYMEMVTSSATRETNPSGGEAFRKTIDQEEWKARIAFFESEVV